MNILHRLLPATVLFAAALNAAPSPSGYVQSTTGDSNHWAATNWTADDLAQFGGEPQIATNPSTTLLVRYSYFVSNYSIAKETPIWVAHIDTADSASAGAKRTGKKWDRGQYKFRPDENVVTFSKDHNVQFVTDADYTNANPTGLRPVTAKNRITRGHMASNLEMKGEGTTDDEGVLSQQESFSFANVCPQMQGHNAPLWSTLEGDCLLLASKLGRVAVVTGPVFDAKTKSLGRTDAPKGHCQIPIPTAFFKVIIATVNGHTEAVGFLISHRPDLKAADLLDYAKSVREIETATGINFMPLMGQNDEVENHPSDELLDLLQKD